MTEASKNQSKLSFSNRNTISTSSVEGYNNISCLYMKSNRYHAAGLFANKAIEQLATTNNNTMKDKLTPTEQPQFDGTLHSRYSCDILYNAGLSLLLSGVPERAITYFLQVIPEFGSRPQLWLRMGECCISYYQQIQYKKYISNESLLAVTGSGGRGRRLIVK